MWMRLVFLKLELKRAYQRFPQMFAGAIALLFLAGAVLLILGMGLFSLGADMAMMPMPTALCAPGTAPDAA